MSLASNCASKDPQSSLPHPTKVSVDGGSSMRRTNAPLKRSRGAFAFGTNPLWDFASRSQSSLFLRNSPASCWKPSDGYPPMTIPIEERFDRWVQEGKFHKEIVTEPLGDKVKHRYLGLLTTDARGVRLRDGHLRRIPDLQKHACCIEESRQGHSGALVVASEPWTEAPAPTTQPSPLNCGSPSERRRR
jgi:hypothetical protein